MNNIWQISREYAGIAEAGGVKNVVCSLSEVLAENDFNVTVFMPLYGCTSFSCIKDYSEIPDSTVKICVNGTEYDVSFGKASSRRVNFVFIISPLFTEKKGIYTYTEAEEAENKSHKRGEGHKDAAVMEIIFQKAVLEYGKLFNAAPDLVHCHDATTAMIPVFAKELKAYRDTYNDTGFVVTIHNAGPFYHHEFNSIHTAKIMTDLSDAVLQKGLRKHFVEPYLLAGFYSTLTTVSSWYADELMDPNDDKSDGLSELFFKKKIQIHGITNGIDYDKYNPADKEVSCLPYEYNPLEKDFDGKKQCRDYLIQKKIIDEDFYRKNPAPKDSDSISQFGTFCSMESGDVYFSYHGRFVHQKGLDILSKAIPLVLEKNKSVKFIIMGQGSNELEKEQIKLAEKYTGNIVYFRGYEKALTRLCVAAADYIILPSQFEPCGLEDFIASVLGTVPLAHATGGLKKIIDGKTGFLYENNTPEELAEKILSAADFFARNHDEFISMTVAAAENVKANYSWENIVEKGYIPLYKKIIKKIIKPID